MHHYLLVVSSFCAFLLQGCISPCTGSTISNPLWIWGQQHHLLQGPVVWKWKNYFDVYHRVLSHLRGRDALVLLEIGVNTGGSIDMYQGYFGDGFEYHGIDLNDKCKQFERTNVSIHIGSQGDRRFLSSVVAAIGKPIDVIVDDGSHIDALTIRSMQGLFRGLSSDGGLYIVEDLQRASLFRKFLTRLVSDMHSPYQDDFRKNRKRCSTLAGLGEAACMEVYHVQQFHNIAVIEKRQTHQPDRQMMWGKEEHDFKPRDYMNSASFQKRIQGSSMVNGQYS